MMNAAKNKSFQAAYEPTFFALRKSVIVAFIGSTLNNAPRHRPLVDAQLQHHQYVSYESNQRSGNHKNMQCKKTGEGCTGDDGSTDTSHRGAGNGLGLRMEAPIPKPQ